MTKFWEWEFLCISLDMKYYIKYKNVRKYNYKVWIKSSLDSQESSLNIVIQPVKIKYLLIFRITGVVQLRPFILFGIFILNHEAN